MEYKYKVAQNGQPQIQVVQIYTLLQYLDKCASYHHPDSHTSEREEGKQAVIFNKLLSVVLSLLFYLAGLAQTSSFY